MNLSLSGDENLKRILTTMPERVQKQLMRHALRVAAKAVQADAQRIAPDETGALAKSIKIRALKRSRTRVGIRIYTDADTLIAEGQKGFYGAFTELGTSNESPRPFLRPALEGNIENAKSLISTDIKDACEGRA